MKRRDFLTGATAGLAVGTAATAITTARKARAADAPAVTRKREKWRMVTSWPQKFPGLGTGAERLANRITAMSDGRLTVEVNAAGSLVPALGVFDAVSQGSAEMGHSASYYWQGKSKAFNFFTSVPFGLTANELSAWIHDGGGQALYDEGYARFGLKPFMAGSTGPQMGGWFREEIATLEDFRGIKMRMPGLGGEVLRRVGATAENLPGGEIFSALSSGRINAAEWVGPWNDLAFGFYKAARNYYAPGFQDSGSGVECFVNKAKYDALPRDLQEIIATACRAEVDAMLADFTRNNAVALRTLVEKHGVKLRRYPDEVLAELARAAKEVLGELEGADDLTKRTYNSFKAFQAEAIGWSSLADQEYMQARNLFFKPA